jgi:hypothetical protein
MRHHRQAMTEIVPSYMRKLRRADRHLAELKRAIDTWAGRHPYEVRTTTYKKRSAFHLAFTEDPVNTEIGIVVADLVYNLRSALDHLTAALVPPADRDSVYFPVFWKGVWEQASSADTSEHAKDRARWQTTTRNMKGGAVALLKRVQPSPSSSANATVSVLVMLNRLSNTDRHRQLPVFAKALRLPAVRWEDSMGTHVGSDARTQELGTVLEDGAELVGLPRHATNVQIRGVPVVAVRVGNPGGRQPSTVELPDALEKAITVVREFVVSPLMVHLSSHEA